VQADASEEYLPAAQSEQKLAPAADVEVPASQSTQKLELVAPDMLRNFPITQLSQVIDPVLWAYCPLAQSVHSLAAAAEKVPMMQGVQAVELTTLTFSQQHISCKRSRQARSKSPIHSWCSLILWQNRWWTDTSRRCN